MNLTNRITKLERAVGRERCDCPDSAEFSWPGHQPDPNCTGCSGERLIYSLAHRPRDAEPLLRAALPILAKAYKRGEQPDLDNLTNQELEQLRKALSTQFECLPREVSP